MDLFSEFKAQTFAEWKAQLLKDLKGESFEGLIWHNENGFDVEPYYTKEQLNHKYEPAFFHNNWEVSVSLRPAQRNNKRLLQVLSMGASAFELEIGADELPTILKDVQLPYIQSTFIGGLNHAILLKEYLHQTYETQRIEFSFFHSHLTSEENLADAIEINKLLSPFEGARGPAVDLVDYHNRGCSAAFEIALAFAALAEFYEKDPSVFRKPPVLKFAVSSDYFVEVAKLRAVRRLWELMKNEFDTESDVYIIATTGLANKTVSGKYNNLIRTSVEGMAAVIGGCNELCVTGFDELNLKPTDFSQRIAINQQLILREECYLDRFADVSCGSYFIETLTDMLAEKALEDFKEVVHLGGFIAIQKSGWIQEKINRMANTSVDDLRSGKRIIVGVNKFQDPKEGHLDVHSIPLKSMGYPVAHVELTNSTERNHG